MNSAYDIVFESDGFLIVNKLSPIPVLPDKSGDASLRDILRRARSEQFLEAAHRIDRRTSGLVAFGRTHRALADLSAAFRDRSVRKVYWAVVEHRPEPVSGRLVHRITRDARRNVTKALPVEKLPHASDAEPEGPDIAALEYRSIAHSDNYTLLEITPVTGRSHQIRAQLSAIGLPIRGDLKYGARRSTENGLIMLHAREIAFPLPRSGTVEAAGEPPDDEPLWKAFSA